jgi:hypothetical protein
MSQTIEGTYASEPNLVPVDGVDVNKPLTDAQKFTLTNIRLKKSNVQRQIADLQTTEAKLDGIFFGELTKAAIENKIDMARFVLSDDLDLKPIQKS